MPNKRNKYIALFCTALVALLFGLVALNHYRGGNTQSRALSPAEISALQAATSNKAQSDAAAIVAFDPKTTNPISQKFRHQQHKSNSALPASVADIDDLETGDADEICGMTIGEARAFNERSKTDFGIHSNIAYAALTPTIAKFMAAAAVDEQIAGLFTQRKKIEHEALMEKLTSSPSCNPLNPYNARAVCEHQTPKTTEDRLSAPIAALLTLAENSGSIDAYAAAWYACKNNRVNACKGVNAHTWAKRDPTNFTAWLAAANESRISGDTAGVEAAMQGARATTTDNKRFPNLANLLEVNSLQSQSPQTHSLVATELFIASLAQMYAAAGLVNYCGLNSGVPQARGEICNALLTKQLDYARDYYGLTHVLTLAERWGAKCRTRKGHPR